MGGGGLLLPEDMLLLELLEEFFNFCCNLIAFLQYWQAYSTETLSINGFLSLLRGTR